MRINFVENKQKELIKNFKNKKNLTWRELASYLGIKEGRLKAYVEETSLITEELYKLLDQNKN